ncbi:FecR domain-containing protein [Adhaeribacter swui]|uniref:FecR domain-containing protein n=1 Tax=Adhaeribacter swui TaxID=2086471 RepID=A0A7G7GCB0_9BACT|nr:FecR domain-containing protein [Adhaeribacter swui]QNF34794.1 FecR domain-containing protein [Adhaeribacter swui]
MNDELLTKYLLGETTPEENTNITQWLALSEDNKKKFAHFKLIWDTSKQLALKSTVNEHEAWQRFKQKRAQQEPPEAVIRPIAVPKTSSFNWLQVAAVILFVSVGAWATYLMFSRQNQVSYAQINLKTTQNTLIDTLPDGSVITLNKNSQFSYPEQFTGNSREVALLEGEAFFNVTPDKAKPFRVKVNEVTVQVVGTSFNVKTSPQATEVIVETGKVQVSKQAQAVSLTPKEMVVVHAGEAKLIKAKTTDQLYTYYRSKKFIANNTPLWRLIEVMNEAYNANIVIARKELRDVPLTSTFIFENQSLQDNLNVISQTVGLQVEKRGDEIILK